MENKEAKKASENEVSDNTINDTNVVEPVVPNSTDLQDGHDNSRSPGKDRGGDRSVEAQNSPRKDSGGDRSVEAKYSPGKDRGGDRSVETQN